MIRASTHDAIRRRKTNAAAIGGCSAVAALTAIGFTAVCGGFDQYKNSSAAEVNKESAPKVLRSGPVLEIVQSVAPSSTFVPSMGTSVRPSETPSIAWQPSGSSVPSFRLSRSMAPYLQPSSSSTPTETETPSGFPTATESLEPTDLPTATMINFPMYGSGKPVSVEPTEYPMETRSIIPTCGFGGLSLAPSASATMTNGPLRMEAPTMTNAPSITPTVSHSPTDHGSKGTFRLRMHWQPGYLWQELPDEDWFCVGCAVCDPTKDPLFGGLKNCDLKLDCEEDMQLALTRCNPTSLGPMKLDEIVTFKFLHGTAEDGLEGDQLQIFGTNLCVSTVKTEDNIKSQEVPGGNGSLVLKPCDSSLESQRFWGGRSVGQAFELLPLSGKRLKCLTNHHHPRQEEQIYSEDCDLARKPDTSLWCPFFPEHDTIGSCETVTASPTIKPTRMPVTSKPSTARPTRTPTNPPTPRPTKFPTPPPTSRPTKFPTLPPTSRPTKFPTLPPTSRPTKLATVPPTSRPTKVASEPAPASLFI